MQNLVSRFKNNKWQILFLLLIVLAGLIIRLKGLGKWPLAIDEYYIVKSVENILNSGLPEWSSGGYYLRGLLFQYCVAGLLILGLKAEFAVRIIPALLGMITVIPLYLLTRRISEKLATSLIIILFCFSVWEIEFSRFGRMYIPFQFTFITYLFFLYQIVIEKKEKAIKWLFALSLLSIFIYEGGIFLVLLNFLVFIFYKKYNLYHLLLALILLIVSYFYLTFDFGNFNVQHSLPADINYNENAFLEKEFIRVPKLLISSIFDNGIWLYITIIPYSLSIFCLYKIFEHTRNNVFKAFLFFVLILLAALNLMGLVIILSICFFLLGWFKFDELKTVQFKYFLAALFILVIYWICYSLFSNILYQYYNEFETVEITGLFKRALRLLFNYPNFYFISEKYFSVMPFFSVVFFGAASFGLYTVIKKNENAGLRLIYLILILSVLMVAFINTFYNDTRYTFFLFPLVLMLTITSLKAITDYFLKSKTLKNITFIICFSAFLFFTEDFNLNHILNIDSREVNFRTIYSYEIESHYFWRSDVKGVADIINKESKENDIIVTNDASIVYYLKNADYFFEDYRTNEFAGIAVENASKERWTNLPLIYSISDFKKLLENSKDNVWFAAREKDVIKDYPFYLNPHENLYYYKDQLIIYKFSKRAN